MKLLEKETDILRELSNIGGGNAATALSKILNTEVGLTIPDVHLLDYPQLFNIIGEPDDIVVSTFANVSGALDGLMMFILSVESTEFIFNLIGTDKIDYEKHSLGNLNESAISEISNIVFNNYLNSLSKMSNQNIISDQPFLVFDMLGAVLNYPINIMPELADKIIFMDSTFLLNKQKINTYLMLISDYENLIELIKKLGA